MFKTSHLGMGQKCVGFCPKSAQKGMANSGMTSNRSNKVEHSVSAQERRPMLSCVASGRPSLPNDARRSLWSKCSKWSNRMISKSFNIVDSSIKNSALTNQFHSPPCLRPIHGSSMDHPQEPMVNGWIEPPSLHY